MLKSCDSLNSLVLDGSTLTCEVLAEAAHGKLQVTIAEGCWRKIRAARAVVKHVIASGVAGYGISTGVGSQKEHSVSAEEIAEYNAARCGSRNPGSRPPSCGKPCTGV